ncbi:MAG: 16S rRNA (guanine(966)-N(2))-methyltransferase RsmD [Syntrophaceae bacterium]|nr:16S rRNA (guanine(966)-N(2))-methyltransferase RsmD [Syntrophaceae bacterium]
MRIVGGTKKGFPIRRPNAADVRPTTDQIKESIFNILRSLEGRSFLDLFAGTGSVGLEALSRGARRAVFVERNTALARSIKEHVKQMQFERQAEVISLEMKKALALLLDRNEVYDYIFIDPPYQRGLVEETLSKIYETGLVGKETIIIVQHSKRELVNWNEKSFSIADRRQYGDSVLTFLKINKETGN